MEGPQERVGLEAHHPEGGPMTAQPMLPKLTIGLDLSDTSGRYCAVDAHAKS